MFNSPGNMVSGPKWKAALYIDERASSEQAGSLTMIYSGQAGGFFAATTNFIDEMLVSSQLQSNLVSMESVGGFV